MRLGDFDIKHIYVSVSKTVGFGSQWHHDVLSSAHIELSLDADCSI